MLEKALFPKHKYMLEEQASRQVCTGGRKEASSQKHEGKINNLAAGAAKLVEDVLLGPFWPFNFVQDD